MTDDELFLRGARTAVACWEAFARASTGASVHRLPGVSVAVFPEEPERAIYNNAILERGLGPAERAAAIAELEALYAAAGVERFAAWAHEADAETASELERRGYVLDTTTRAMGMSLDELRLPRPELALGAPDWLEHLRVIGVPAGLLRGLDLGPFHLVVASADGENVATALAYDADGDCGVYNVATLEHVRRRGLGTALAATLVHDALARGCRTASLQSTPEAERVYAAAGFRDLGRILEYVPAG